MMRGNIVKPVMWVTLTLCQFCRQEIFNSEVTNLVDSFLVELSSFVLLWFEKAFPRMSIMYPCMCILEQVTVLLNQPWVDKFRALRDVSILCRDVNGISHAGFRLAARKHTLSFCLQLSWGPVYNSPLKFEMKESSWIYSKWLTMWLNAANAADLELSVFVLQ